VSITLSPHPGEVYSSFRLRCEHFFRATKHILSESGITDCDRIDPPAIRFKDNTWVLLTGLKSDVGGIPNYLAAGGVYTSSQSFVGTLHRGGAMGLHLFINFPSTTSISHGRVVPMVSPASLSWHLGSLASA
jgi:hypothetical protein